MKVQLTDISLSDKTVNLIFRPIKGHSEHKDLVTILTIRLDQFPENKIEWAMPDVSENGENKNKIVLKFEQFDNC